MASSENTGATPANGQVDAVEAEKRYSEERTKRFRDDGIDQFVDIARTDNLGRFQDDPWIDEKIEASIKDMQTMFPNNQCKVLILGAGFAGLQHAISILESTKSNEITSMDIRIVDSAGGFGGAWYWNRYPGLTCDLESYAYLPRLEDTGYEPEHRYSYSEEIREYAAILARRWNLIDSAVFQTKAGNLQWDETTKEWEVDLVQQRMDKSQQRLKIRSRIVVLANGVLNYPHLPGVPGLQDFSGDMFHTSRWNYSLTGGSPKDQKPSLTKLKEKHVAIIGTGCTGVGAVSHLAEYAKHLYVVQRTPSSVDRLGQRETDPEWFRKEVATGPGWQRERVRNAHAHLTLGPKPAVNMLDDHWTNSEAVAATDGCHDGPRTLEELPAFIKALHASDLKRQNRIRAQVSQDVHDQTVANSLHAWYPTWCKRFAFSNEYNQSFNRPNVTLVDTQGKGVERFTADGIVANGQTYQVDLVVFATGFRTPIVGSPAEKADAKIIGRNGVSMTEKWAENGAGTIHGVLDHNFPNLFLSGPWQGGLGPNNAFSVGMLAEHASHILAAAYDKAKGKPFEVAPTAAAVETWANQMLEHSPPTGAMMGCTPSYFNAEGTFDRLPQEEQMKLARSGVWGHGIEDFDIHLKKWRADGGIERDIEVLV